LNTTFCKLRTSLHPLLTLLIAIALSATLSNTYAGTKHDNIVVLGDSLSAAYGIQLEQGWVALLSDKLKDSHRVINGSISGETTGGGLRSLPVLLTNHTPQIVIIELGANDGLRGFPPPVIETNLREMITLAQDAGAQVLLVGMHIPPNYGAAYSKAFHAIYGKLNAELSTVLVPFMLEGVATEPELMQDDGLHPKANAQTMILNTIWPYLDQLLNGKNS